MAKDNRKLAVCGVIGGVLMMIANILTNTGTGFTGEVPEPGWLFVPIWVCGTTEVLALLGAVGYLAGWVSLLKMAEEACSARQQKLLLWSAFGIVGMGVFHENICCFEPIMAQILSQGGVENLYPAMQSVILHIFIPLDLMILLSFYVQVYVLVSGVLSGKIGVRKRLLLLSPAVGLILGVILWTVLPGPIKGIGHGVRNLSEGLMYLIPYDYWKSK